MFPWRGAAKYWPAADGDTFAERCAVTLIAHTAEIFKARGDLPVVWGGDFNQALSGTERVGSDVGREALLEAFKKLGLRAVTNEPAGQDPPQREIDHIAIPLGWSVRCCANAGCGDGELAFSDLEASTRADGAVRHRSSYNPATFNTSLVFFNTNTSL